MSTVPVAFIVIAQQLMAAIVFALPPVLYHSGKFVGVPVVSEFTRSPEGRALLRGWWKYLLLSTALCSALALGGALYAEKTKNFGGIVATGFALRCIFQVILLLGGIIALRLKASRYAITPAPSGIRVASLRPRDPLPAPHLRRFLMLAPLLLFALAVIYLLLRWDNIPERFPMHWNARGQVDHWGTRRPADVFAPLVIGLFAYALIAAVLKLGILSALKPRGRLAYELLITGVAWLIGGGISVAAMVMPFLGKAGLPIIVTSFVTLPLILVVIFTLVWSHLSKDLPPDPPASAVDIERMQARHWRCGGLFYYNPDDPALSVEKRVGLGTTPNMAHKAAWMPLVLVLLFAISLPFLINLVLKMM